MARETHATTVARWKRLIDGLAEDGTDIPELRRYRERLEALYAQTIELAAQRDIHRAAKQQASRDLKETLEQGRKIATVIGIWLKDHYGGHNPKLHVFGLRPFHRRPPKKDTPEG